MLYKSVKVLVLSGLSLVSAANVPSAQPAEVVRDLAPRQTDNLLSELLEVANKLGLTACIPQALPLVSVLPPIPSGLINQDLLTQALSQTTLAVSEVCSFSITGDAGPKYSSYLPTIYSWYNAYSATLASLVSECPSASPLLQTVSNYGSCSQVLALETGSLSIQTNTAAATTAASAATTTTSKSSSAGSASTSAASSPSSSVSQGQAPRETGLMLAAAAMAGFIGAVAAL
jgi:hypothetical protein